MAVVTASFTKSKGGAKASIRYIAYRPGKDGEDMQRQLFGHDGALFLNQADKMVDEAEKGTVFFRLIISPDPTTEDREKDLDLRELTLRTILTLEERFKKEIQFVAAEHNDHTPNRHLHVIALVPGRLAVADLETLRTAATQAALFQRQERDLQQQDLTLAYRQQAREAVPERPFARTVYLADRTPQELEATEREPRQRGSKPSRSVTICHLCGQRVGKGYAKCFNCGARLAVSLDLGDNGVGY